ncbi:4'-phosphopantetheinyl transferase [hydrothermal vent metagenome]|uniref:4'-phosphopantetheinyl transferase n=1 Tax=hydrothermal vent metagenome TaxID=652676 RepID=A0A3B0Y7C1_9ZZZZ
MSVTLLEFGAAENTSVFSVILDQADAALEKTLSNAEIDRANAFKFPHLRIRYIKCRSALRSILSRYLDLPPEQIVISLSDTGRPFLDGCHLDFNVSHSEDHALIAVLNTDGRIGIDLESISPLAELDNIAETVLTPTELKSLYCNDNKLLSFYRYWTGKEAYLKAIGTGLSVDPRTIEINIEDANAPLLIKGYDQNKFKLQSALVVAGFVATIATSI